MSDLIKRTNKARRFPTNTCPASRHAARIGEALVRGKPYPMLTEESAHCGESILSAVASLWEARTEIERLTDENGRLRADLLAGRNVVNAGLTIHTLTLERDELRRQLDPMGEYTSADELIATLHAEKAEDDAMKRDAQRYRWLRNEANTARKCDPMVCIYPLDEQDLIDGDRLDVAIDAAMGGSNAG